MEKWLLILLVLPCAYGAICGTDNIDESCTVELMQSLVDSSADGDTIYIASGTHTWDSRVIVNKRITISGKGTCDNCGETATPTGNWPARINIDNNQAFLVRGVDGTGIIRITGLHIEGPAGYVYDWYTDNTGTLIHVSLNNHAEYRFDNMYTVATDSAASYGAMHYVLHNSFAYGVLDNNYMFNEENEGGIMMVHECGEGDGDGDEAFMKAPLWGTDEFVFIEKNSIVYDCDGASWPLFGPGSVDGFAGARFVFRNNYARNNFILFHDHSGGGYSRGGAAAEVYDNVFEWYDQDGCVSDFGGHTVYIRSGTWLIHNNDFSDNWNSIIGIQIGRLSGSQGNWGECGDNVWDGDGLPAGYPCLDQPGWMQSSGVTPSTIQPQIAEPIRLWSNTKPANQDWTKVNYPQYTAENREWYLSDDDSVKPAGYTPYTYPHPLTQGSASDELIPADRRIDWSPGVEGGIPDYPVAITATDPPYNADNTGASDASSAIQSALNACPAGHTVYLPSGEYRLDTGDNWAIQIPDNVVLRGAGPDKTRLKITGSQDYGIMIGDWGSLGTSTGISAGYTKSSNELTLSSVSGLSVGDIVLIDQEIDSNLVMGSHPSWCARDGRYFGQLVEIDSINGNTITIDPPLAYTYDHDLNPQMTGVNNIREFAGVEDLYIEKTGASLSLNIRFYHAANCWVKNIESNNASKHHIQLDWTFRSEVRDSFIHHAQSYDNGGFGYGVVLYSRSSDNLIENNVFDYLRHPMLMTCTGSGNVFGYNLVDHSLGTGSGQDGWLFGDAITHGSHPHMSLFEGNYVNQIHVDSIHGSASHITFFRNWADGQCEGMWKNLHAVDLMRYNQYINLVGNVLGDGTNIDHYELVCPASCSESSDSSIYQLGYSGDNCNSPCGPEVVNTLLRHGNYDYFNQDVLWNPGISEHNLPDSLYLDSKPAFFGSLAWPPIGPDIVGYVNDIPAKIRFEGCDPMTLDELIVVIDDWKSGAKNINEIMQTIIEWKTGC